MSEFTNKDLLQAVANANEAMARVEAGAGKIWNIAARFYLDAYPEEVFTTEDLRAWAYRNGMPPPPNIDRAWGPVIRKAKIDGIMVFVKWVLSQNPKTHNMPVRQWRKSYFSGLIEEVYEYDA